jgi:hypothetical protein
VTAEPVQDVLMLAIPEQIDPLIYTQSGSDVREAFTASLQREAVESVWAQWPTRPPVRVDFDKINWLITKDVADIESFQPAHDCPDCWMGNLQAEEFLKANPGRWIAMANITYTPVWE